MQSQSHGNNFDTNFGIKITFSLVLRREALKKIGMVELLSVLRRRKQNSH